LATKFDHRGLVFISLDKTAFSFVQPPSPTFAFAYSIAHPPFPTFFLRLTRPPLFAFSGLCSPSREGKLYPG
jgi:hypothetical protein